MFFAADRHRTWPIAFRDVLRSSPLGHRTLASSAVGVDLALRS
jgi:hypothetical protein